MSKACRRFWFYSPGTPAPAWVDDFSPASFLSQWSSVFGERVDASAAATSLTRLARRRFFRRCREAKVVFVPRRFETRESRSGRCNTRIKSKNPKALSVTCASDGLEG
jgi:hypothetical protein